MTTVAANARLEGIEYRFNLERLAELNRSPIPLLLARLSRPCPSYGKAASEIGDPNTLIAEIRVNCADDPDFIRQSMPLQEIVFRTLLLAEDQTMTLGEIHRELTERWSSPIRPISVTIAGLARILDSDVFYGFDPIALPEPEIIEPDLPMLRAGEDGEDRLLREILSAIDDDAEEYDEEELFDDDNDDPYEEGEDDEDD